MPCRRPRDARKIVPRPAFHHVPQRLRPERRRRPLEHLPGHVEHAVRTLAVRVAVHRHRVERPCVVAVQPLGVKRVAPREVAPVGAAGRLFPLRLARQPCAAPGAIGGGIGVADQHHGVLLAARRRASIAPQEFDDGGVAVDQPVAAPDRLADKRRPVPGFGNESRVVGVGHQIAVDAIRRHVETLAGFDLEPALPTRHGAAVQGFIQPIPVFPLLGGAAHYEFPRRDGDHRRRADLAGVADCGEMTYQYQHAPRQHGSQAHDANPPGQRFSTPFKQLPA